ncbi:PAS domain S-box protein [Jidongwangia harbinensis]|uniref:PAS domain S-box protein n=1 Tax=Jidongwangia harbinensis TaxID=2878561 RepID=UPI001CD92F7E|nr:PAS domain S-box protein [Jidongwangia harbinensis]MCA2211763.1 PAS domain S-box protein [Jidongwangia harbinensis]
MTSVLPPRTSEHEQQRLAALHEYRLLDAPADDELEAAVRVAALVAGVPTATLNLIDEHRQCQLTTVGFDGADSARTDSMCAIRFETGEFVHVPDASADPTYGANPWVTGILANVRFYASAPLVTPQGHALGTLCVFDTEVRELTGERIERLKDLAAMILALFERRRQARRNAELAAEAERREQAADEAAARLQAVLASAQDAFVSMTAEGRVSAWNDAAERLFGWSAAEAVGRPATELFIPARFHDAHEAGLARVRRGEPSTLAGQRLELAAVDRAGREFPVEMTLQVSAEHGDPAFHAFLHDITPRRQAQQLLEAERRRLADERTFLQTLLDSLDTGVVACGSDGRLALFNQAVRELHGLDEQPLDATDWAGTYALLAEDGRTPLRPDQVPLARAYAGDTVRGQHLVVRRPGGEIRRFLANGRPIDATDGRRLGAVVAMHDITDAHRAEQHRRTRYAVAQALSEATSGRDAAAAAAAAAAAELGWACAEYWQVDEDGQHVTRASSWTAPGRRLHDFTGDLPLSFPAGVGLAGTVWQRGSHVWTGDISADTTVAGRHQAAVDAGLRTAIGLPVRSGEQVVGVLAFFADTDLPTDVDVLGLLDSIATHVSRYVERRRAEDLTLALAAARRDFDRVVEQVNDYLWTVEIRPDGTVHSVYASPNGTGVFGAELPTDADMGAALAERVHPGDREIFQHFHATVSAGEPADVEVRIVGDDGVTRWVWTRAVARRENGRLLVDGICTNVTDRRELAEQREQLLTQEKQQVRRLQELDRLKDEFVAVVVHELRNPIGVIAGYTEMLRDDPELAGRRELAVLDRTSKHLQTLVDDLLELARLDAGHTSIDPRPVPPGRLLREAAAAQQPAADAHRVTLTARITCTRILLGDARRLRQVVDNLLSNAIKYTPPGGTVTLGAADSPDGITITVADTGIGIPAEQYPQLFTRFFRASTATTRGIKGTGLGLAISKAIVEAHGGTVTAQPAPGGGTTFTVTLPADTTS